MNLSLLRQLKWVSRVGREVEQPRADHWVHVQQQQRIGISFRPTLRAKVVAVTRAGAQAYAVDLAINSVYGLPAIVDVGPM